MNEQWFVPHSPWRQNVAAAEEASNAQPASPLLQQTRFYYPYISPNDPCPPIRVKSFSVPPQLFITFQPPNWPQYTPQEALRVGTLWPALYSPYEPSQT